MNRYSFASLSQHRTKAFYLKPGYRWTINSLGLLENRGRSVHYPLSLEIVDVNERSVAFIDERGGGNIPIGQMMHIYDAADHR